jgi:2-keto-4-pentenoate hydratase/2-oxohepta-3-ene-1,7-dioic acid hydratase in catechol pathway
MRIARFVTPGGDPEFGIVELEEDDGQFPQTVAAINADPLAGPVKYTGARHDLADVRLLAPVIPRSKVIGVGWNYLDHNTSDTAEVPAEPPLFFKPNTSVIGPGEPILKPKETNDLQFEGELAVVIGRICRKVPEDRAAEVIFGYTVGNDISARDLQHTDAQWTRAKGWDTFCPLGPWIVTHFGLEEAGDLSIITTLDGVVHQDGNTNQMIKNTAQLIAYISNFTTLLPGDVILTGTPSGSVTMQPGQRISVEIDGIGTLTNPIMDDSDNPEE